MTQSEITKVSPAASAVQAEALPADAACERSLLKAYMELGKVRLSAMVVVTTALGYIVADRAHPSASGFDLAKLFWTCLGTFFAAVGAGAFNQAIESRRDAKMKRTRKRPIPTGEISRTHAAFFALIICILGVAILCPTSNGLTAVLATANIAIYVLLYTPLKPLSSTNTLVGAVVGAIPPMMGWSAASGGLSTGAWILGGILFVWQIPHFLALAWMYREDYARGGYKMVSTIEPSGRLTGLLAVLYSIPLIPLSLAMVYLHHAGIPFAIFSTVFALGIITLAVRFAITRTHLDARRLFLATILYLPLLTVVLSVDARGPYDGMERTSAGWVMPGK